MILWLRCGLSHNRLPLNWAQSRWNILIPFARNASLTLNHSNGMLLQANTCLKAIGVSVGIRSWYHIREFFLMHWHWTVVHSIWLINKLETFCCDWTKQTYWSSFICVLHVGVHHWTSEGSQKGWGHPQGPNAGVLEMLPLWPRFQLPYLLNEHIRGIYKRCVVVPWVLWISWSSVTWFTETKQNKVNLALVSVLHACSLLSC